MNRKLWTACATVVFFAARCGSAQGWPPADFVPGEVRWAATWDSPTVPGSDLTAVGHVVAASAPGGDVCVAVMETLPGATFGPVVRRLGADGGERWSHAVPQWPSLGAVADAVAAVGDACVVGARAAHPATGLVARVEAGGTAWAAELPGEVLQLDLEPDGRGGVWVGTSEQREFPLRPDAVLTRLDADGVERARWVSSGPPPEGVMSWDVRGVQALTVLPGGRAVALVGSDSLAVVTPDGDGETAPLADGFLGTALAFDEDEPGDVIVLGTVGRGAASAVVQRVSVSGEVRWATELGPAADGARPARASPWTAIMRDGDAYVAWRSGSTTSRLARVDGETGAPRWDVPEPSGQTPRRLVADGEGVLFHAQAGWAAWGALATDGSERWHEAGGIRDGAGRALVACGAGATCFASRTSLTARGPDGSPAWALELDGAPYPRVAIAHVVGGPGGGAYATGRVWTGAEDADLFVGRLTPGGDLDWMATVDGGGTTDAPATVASTPRGGLLVAGSATDEAAATRRVLIASVAPSGEVEWRQTIGSDVAEAGGILATADGAVVLLSDRSQERNAIRLLRLDARGHEVWNTLVADGAAARPVGLHTTPDGIAVVWERDAADVHVERFGPGGGRLEERTLDRASCRLPYGQPSQSASDGQGKVYVSVNGARDEDTGACVGAGVFRFSSGGAVRRTGIGASLAGVHALDVADDGRVAAIYSGERTAVATRAVSIDPAGTIRSDVQVEGDVRLTGVAAGPEGQVVAAGYDPEGFPVLIRGEGAGHEAVPLPGFATLVAETGAVVLDGTTAYVALNSRPAPAVNPASPIRIAGVVRVDGAVEVTAEEAPSAGVRLRVAGPNPSRAGGDARVWLGAPARLVLYDVLGRRIAQWASAAGEVAIGMPEAPGVYILRAEGERWAGAIRLVVTR